MASILNIFSAVLIFFTLTNRGYCQCTLDAITITQFATGKFLENKQEWNVTISNGCICTQTDLKLSCDGFKTAVQLDPSILAIRGDECLVNNGYPVYYSSMFNFSYAWDTPFPFEPISSQIACS